jgi:quinol monooxygenase YgiN
MFIALYRWKVLSKNEAAFRAAWAQMTLLLRARCGSLGSRLHRGDDGALVAYAQWPDRATWQQSSLVGPDVDALRAEMARTAERMGSVVELEVLDDLLVTPTEERTRG